jgi:hypothetical protein
MLLKALKTLRNQPVTPEVFAIEETPAMPQPNIIFNLLDDALRGRS